MPRPRKNARKKPVAKRQFKKRKPVNQGNLRRRNLQPFMETKSVESSATSLYMDVTSGTAAKPQATTILIPESWKTLDRGLTDSTFVGRDVFDRYCNMKLLISFDQLLPFSQHAQTGYATSQINNIKYVQFWAKNTMENATVPTLYNPSEFATIAGKAMVDDNFGSHFLKYETKSASNLKIIKSGYLNPKNKQKNFNPGRVSLETGIDTGSTYPEPIKMSFTWDIKRKNRMYPVPSTTNFVRAESWVPGVCFYSASLHGQDSTKVPHISVISKTWFADS
jgi:hypothetical protein